GDPLRCGERNADLWFHSLILLAARNLTPADIYDELAARRHGTAGG
ncbi:MAG: phosphoribosyl-ATP pyrophosphatase, partial [Chloroflexota bacterium]